MFRSYLEALEPTDAICQQQRRMRGAARLFLSRTTSRAGQVNHRQLEYTINLRCVELAYSASPADNG
jgi:hypothetical protein